MMHMFSFLLTRGICLQPPHYLGQYKHLCPEMHAVVKMANLTNLAKFHQGFGKVVKMVKLTNLTKFRQGFGEVMKWMS